MTQPAFFDPTLWDSRLEQERDQVLRRAGDTALVDIPQGATSTLPRPKRSPNYLNTADRLKIVLSHSATALACNLMPVIHAKTGHERSKAWLRLLEAVAVAVASAGMKEVVMAALRRLRPIIFGICQHSHILTKVRDFLGRCVAATAAVGGTVLKGLGQLVGHLLMACVRGLQLQGTAVCIELREALIAVTPAAINNTAFYAASKAADAVVADVLPGLPFTAALAPVIAISLQAIGQAIAFKVYHSDIRAQWVPWAKRLVGMELQATEWIPMAMPDLAPLGTTEEILDRTPTSLRCPITHTMITDPVRHVRTGQLYEKHAVFKSVDKLKVDPATNIPAKRQDYVAAPTAKDCIEEVAKILGLIQVWIQ
ncbi:hypothetical protein IAU60_000705 [Kwoniella sp. DSM 27419]